ncbi:putative Arf GTPase activating protein [Helianthus anomalus]
MHAGKKKLKDLLQQSDNRACADCGAHDPKWASPTIGVFICLKCCGGHRLLGPNISKVPSTLISCNLLPGEGISFLENYENGHSPKPFSNLTTLRVLGTARDAFGSPRVHLRRVAVMGYFSNESKQQLLLLLLLKQPSRFDSYFSNESKQPLLLLFFF